jgi:ribonuclease M5
MRTQALVDALAKAGVLYEEVAQPGKRVEMIDLFEDGLSGGKNSQAKKAALLKYLDLPERLSTSSFLQLINTFMTYEEYKSAVESCLKEWENG